MRVRLTTMFLLFFMLFSACNNSEFIAQSHHPFSAPPEDGELSVTFFGTTSFLVETPQSQIILDGYFSRPSHKLFRKISPDPSVIHGVLTEHGVCPSDEIKALSEGQISCDNRNHRQLDLIIPLHGHYDHAMDSAYIAGWTGARTLSNPSLDNMYEATAIYAKEMGYAFKGDITENFPIEDHLGLQKLAIKIGDVSVRLLSAPHNENPISGKIARKTADSFRFPSRIWKMGEGDSIAVLLEHKNKNLLFLGSAGDMAGRFEGVHAEVVFLSIGGLGTMTKTQRREYWRDTVETAKARRVFLTHWDNHQKPLPQPGDVLKPTGFEPHARVLAQLRSQAGPDVEIFFLPNRVALNPLDGL